MPEEASIRNKALACAGLVCIQTAVGVLYKASQRGGGFKYSTTSAVTMAEAVKLTLSVTFHVLEHRGEADGAFAAAWSSAKAQLSPSAVMQIWIVAFLYAFNNQLSFFVYLLADPGTIFLFKAGSTLIVAIVQYTFVGKDFKEEQWRAMLLQGVGMVIVQYDPCRSAPLYRPLAYMCMILSTVVTAATTVRNEYQVKQYKIGLNVQNATLYAGGVWMNLLAFLFVPNPNSTQASIGFFEGYSNPLALGVVVCNGLIGLAITAVYKYADAVTKCIAGDITAVLLCIISSFLFGLRASITTWCGVFVVSFAVHLYMEASRAPSAPPAPPKTESTSAEKSSSAATAELVGAANEATEVTAETVERLAELQRPKGLLEKLPKPVKVLALAAPVACLFYMAFVIYPEVFWDTVGMPKSPVGVRECLTKWSEDAACGVSGLEVSKPNCIRSGVECLAKLAQEESLPEDGTLKSLGRCVRLHFPMQTGEN